MVGTNLVWAVGSLRPSLPQKAGASEILKVDGMAAEMPAGRPHDMPITCEPGSAIHLLLMAAKCARNGQSSFMQGSIFRWSRDQRCHLKNKGQTFAQHTVQLVVQYPVGCKSSTAITATSCSADLLLDSAAAVEHGRYRL